MDTIEPPFKVNFKPSEKELSDAVAWGGLFGRRVTEKYASFTDASGKTFWKCTVCGEVFEGALPPATCPVCGVSSDAFIEEYPDVPQNVVAKPLKALIVGSGAAALAAAEAIRVRNNDAEITIITEEALYPYYRPLLSEMYDGSTPEGFYIREKSWYETNRIKVLTNTHIEKIDRENRLLISADGKEYFYDRLLLATGATPFVPPIKGADQEGVLTLRTHADILSLQKVITQKKKFSAVVIGGGLLGLEAACSLGNLGGAVTVIDSAPTILPRQTDSSGSKILSTIASHASCVMIAGAQIKEISNVSTGLAVSLADGKTITADFILVSAGVKPRIELAQNAGLDCDRAIIVDESMMTSDPFIYAAGDCCAVKGRYYGVWEPALAQGRVAGAGMTGDEMTFASKEYPATLAAFGTNLLSIGKIANTPETVGVLKKLVQEDELRNQYRVLYFDGERLCGGLFIGDTSKTALLVKGVNNRFTFTECVERKLVK